MKIFALIAGIVIAAAGLLLVLIKVWYGLFFVALGAFFVIWSRRYQPRQKTQTYEMPSAPRSVPKEIQVSDVVLDQPVYRLGVTSHYYQENILQLMQPTQIYQYPEETLGDKFRDRPLYMYYTKKARAYLVPEPDNEYDENAIKVVANHVHVGYLYRDYQAVGFALIKNGYDALLEIYGGPYKIVGSDGTVTETDDLFRVKLSALPKKASL